MSLLHVLVIPKQRIFNAVTLRNKRYNYRSAQALGRQALQILKDAPSDTPGSLRFWLKDGKLKARKEDMATKCTLPENAEMHSIDHKYSFHVYGDNSIGYLHMHVYDGSLLTKAYEEMGGNEKNTDVDVVKQWASSSENTKLSYELQTYLSFLKTRGYAPTAKTVQLYVNDVLNNMSVKEFPEFMKLIPKQLLLIWIAMFSYNVFSKHIKTKNKHGLNFNTLGYRVTILLYI